MVNTKFDISMLFPPGHNDYAGPTIAFWSLIVFNIVGTLRGVIHTFFHDSGAQSFATMNLNVDGGKNIVAMLAHWGGLQLIMSCIIWIVLWRYQEFIPLMIAEVVAEQIMRIIVNRMKPVITAHTPPGRPVTVIVLVLATIMLIVSLMRNEA